MSTDGFEGMRAHADGVEIDLKISPGARDSEVVGPMATASNYVSPHPQPSPTSPK